jgi:predicted GNAT family acetyltransferase
MAVEPLSHTDADALRALLTKDVAHNLYFLGLLEEFGFDAPEGRARFRYFGQARGGELTAALFVGGEGGLVVPAASSEADLTSLCEALVDTVRLGACLGDKGQVQIATRLLARGTPHFARDLRLFKVSADDLGPFTNPTLRLAREEDVPRLLPLASAAVREFFGRDPMTEDRRGFEARVRQKVRGERTYVLEEAGELVFKVDVGARSEFGAELEGAYTVPAQRHKGHAILSLGQISRHLLSSLPRLTLHVEDDSSLARMARKVGYVPGRSHRLVLME